MTDEQIKRIASQAMLPGLEMALQNHLSFYNQARASAGLAPVRMEGEAPVITRPKRGRPRGTGAAVNYEPETLERVKALRVQGLSVKRLSEELSVSLYAATKMVSRVENTAPELEAATTVESADAVETPRAFNEKLSATNRERRRLVREAGLDTGHMPTRATLEKARRILARRKAV